MSNLHAAIAKQYAAPEYATFFEVRDAAGFKARRSADAISMSLWPSRGLSITGFEIKHSRSDWLSEKRNPEKSASIQRYCDRWYIVVPNDTIVKEGELPETWGLKILQGKILKTKIEAPPLKPEPLSRDFVACLLRRASESVVPLSVVEERIREAVEQSKEIRKSSEGHALFQLKADYDHLRKQVSEFEQASGVKIQHYQGVPKVGATVRFVLESDGDVKLHLERFKKQLENLVASTNEALTELSLEKPKREYPPRRK